MKKRLTLLTIATLFIAGAFAVPAQAQTSSFADVSEANPAHNAIQYLADNSIITGLDNGTFDPNGVLGRGQAVKILVGWRDEPLSASSSHFTDVDPTYQPYVETALAKGWLAGYPDGTFRPYDSVTREQAAILVDKSLGLGDQALALTAPQIAATLGPFLDAVAVSPSARSYVALAIQKGLISGDNGRLNPLDPMTRAQFCMVVFRAAGVLDPTLAVAPAPAPATKPSRIPVQPRPRWPTFRRKRTRWTRNARLWHNLWTRSSSSPITARSRARWCFKTPTGTAFRRSHSS